MGRDASLREEGGGRSKVGCVGSTRKRHEQGGQRDMFHAFECGKAQRIRVRRDPFKNAAKVKSESG
jgi:hypothetical protein